VPTSEKLMGARAAGRALQWGAGLGDPDSQAPAAASGRQGCEPPNGNRRVRFLGVIAAGKILGADLRTVIKRFRDTSHAIGCAMDPRVTPASVGATGTCRSISARASRKSLSRTADVWSGVGGAASPIAIRVGHQRLLRRSPRHLDSASTALVQAVFRPECTHMAVVVSAAFGAAQQTATGVRVRCTDAWQPTRATLHGALANRLLARGTDIACERPRLCVVARRRNFRRRVRDRAPGSW